MLCTSIVELQSYILVPVGTSDSQRLDVNKNRYRHVFAFQWLSLKETYFLFICIDDKISNVQLLSTD